MSDDNLDKSFEKLDQEKITQAAAEKASQAAIEEVKKAQQELIDRMGGSKKKYSWEERGDTKPQSYDELFDNVKKQVPTLTEEQVDKKVNEILAKKEEDQRKREEEEQKKKAQSIEENRKKFDQEWYDLVQQGKMPQVDKKLTEKINKGERLTRDEIEKDEGLSARLKLAQLSQNTGKSAKLAFYEEWDKQSPGATAPVMGGRPSITRKEKSAEDMSYDEDVLPLRKKLFGF